MYLEQRIEVQYTRLQKAAKGCKRLQKAAKGCERLQKAAKGCNDVVKILHKVIVSIKEVVLETCTPSVEKLTHF